MSTSKPPPPHRAMNAIRALTDGLHPHNDAEEIMASFEILVVAFLMMVVQANPTEATKRDCANAAKMLNDAIVPDVEGMLAASASRCAK